MEFHGNVQRAFGGDKMVAVSAQRLLTLRRGPHGQLVNEVIEKMGAASSKVCDCATCAVCIPPPVLYCRCGAPRCTLRPPECRCSVCGGCTARVHSPAPGIAPTRRSWLVVRVRIWAHWSPPRRGFVGVCLARRKDFVPSSPPLASSRRRITACTCW